MGVVRMLRMVTSPNGPHAVLTFILISCTLFLLCAGQVEETLNRNSSEKNSTQTPVSQVRYRMRPVAAFQSGNNASKRNSSSSTSSESSENNSSSTSAGVPFITVHDLTSQTFEKLHENWRNVEAFLRNLRAGRSQEDRSASPSDSSATAVDTTRRPTLYTFRYHPVVLEGEGTNSVDDIASNGNSRVTPPRTFNGVNFNPFPYDPKGGSSKTVDMERHTVATVYTIGICLTIMAIGSVMFILINKCDGSGSNYSHSSTGYNAGRRMLGLGNSRTEGRRGNSSNNGRSRHPRSGRSQERASNSANTASGSAEAAAKSFDLPPSYASLFPDGGPKLQETCNKDAECSTAVGSELSVIQSDNRNSNSSAQPHGSNSES